MPATALSVFDLFRVGIGPSSSHTSGPMRAARAFVADLDDGGRLDDVRRLEVDLFGSLALTGRGHGTDRAVLLGLEGVSPEDADPEAAGPRVAAIRGAGRVRLLGRHEIPFDQSRHLRFCTGETLARHTNGLRFTAFDARGAVIHQDDYFSVGGGFIERAGDPARAQESTRAPAPYPFTTAAELLQLGRQHHLSIADIVEANERTWRTKDAIRAGLLDLWREMRACAERGLRTEGVLPGGLNVVRRAPRLRRRLERTDRSDPLRVMDSVNAFAMAVNEENAGGGRVVTAPTNGAAGLVPAVLHYYTQFTPGASDEGICAFLRTAGAIGMLYKLNASISGAEVGCQGEVGVACSMAAAGLVAVLGGTNEQMAQAAEIGMEHHLGMTCDPVGGLVQIPCIERNAVGAVKAINAARMALASEGEQRVSLDQVIETMWQTGRDMQARYKETALAGLAVNVVEC